MLRKTFLAYEKCQPFAHSSANYLPDTYFSYFLSFFYIFFHCFVRDVMLTKFKDINKYVNSIRVTGLFKISEYMEV